MARRVEVTFPGLSMGIFAGDLRFTSYRGTNLFRMDAIAKTDEPSVAYKYEAGLKGFSTEPDAARDLARHRRRPAAVPSSAASRTTRASPSRPGTACSSPRARAARWRRSRRRTASSSRVRSTRTSATSGTGRTATRQFGLGVRQADGEEVAQYIENFALLQRAARHVAAHVGVLLRERRRGRADAAGGDGLHPRRPLQADARLQDDGEPFPPAVHRASARVRIARHTRSRT